MDRTASSLGPQPWPCPDSLQAMVAAPAYQTRLFENERVRVLRTQIPAGALVPLHTHRHPAVAYLLGWSHFVRRDPRGKITLDNRQLPVAQIPAVQCLAPRLAHTVENVGLSDITIVIVELKNLTGH